MSENTAIEWTDHTFNPWWGCTRVSKGCEHCYAETWAKRTGFDIWGPGSRRTFGEKHWNEPLKWNRDAERAGVRRRVFCASMADVFEDQPDLPSERLKLWILIEQTPWLDWQLLTKRPENMGEMLPHRWKVGGIPRNVWFGVSMEDQPAVDKRWPILRAFIATHRPAVTFISAEPLLGPIDLERSGVFGELTQRFDPMFGPFKPHRRGPRISWVIVGGESGPGARPMHPEWARSIRDQCVGGGVAYLFKQWGNWSAVPDAEGRPGDQFLICRKHLPTNGKPIHDAWELYPWRPDNPPMTGAEAGRWSPYADALMRNVGKKAAGRLLDGRTWDEYPQQQPQLVGGE